MYGFSWAADESYISLDAFNCAFYFKHRMPLQCCCQSLCQPERCVVMQLMFLLKNKFTTYRVALSTFNRAKNSGFLLLRISIKICNLGFYQSRQR